MEKSIIKVIERALRKYWDLPSLTNYGGATFTYKDVARKIVKIHILFEKSGIQKGDKVAFCGKNSASWGVGFLAALTYGAVVVPILHEFKPDNVHNIVNHSEAKILFVGDEVWTGLDEASMPALIGIISPKPAKTSTRYSASVIPSVLPPTIYHFLTKTPKMWA